MNSIKILLVFTLTLIGAAAFAQSKTDSVKVLGNCGMCKSRIEKALDVAGVSKAAWNADTQMLTVSYDQAKVNLNDIQQRVAAVGHDTPKYKAPDAVYEKLHDCCKYDRVAAKAKPAKKTGH